MTEPIHVYPLNDQKPHILIGTLCQCQPSLQEYGSVIIHYSFDGREFYEADNVAVRGH